jgi:hypothetical protein
MMAEGGKMSKERRNLSGIFFRQKNLETNKYENVCFEELRPEEQDRVMSGREPGWLMSLSKKLGETLKEIGDLCDVYKG